MLTHADYLAAKARLEHILPRDPNAGESGEYFIRSLYFDDVEKTAYLEKLSGVAERKKYRLRIYNCEKDVIKLECKEKNGDKIHKTSANIDYADAAALTSSDFNGLANYENRLCQTVYSLAKGKGLAPSVVVDYTREAYIYPVGNVRITFDKELHAGIESADIFNKDLVTLPIYPDGSVILEVKYDGIIPYHISKLISGLGGKKLALSKFCLCRDALSALKPKY